MNLEALIKSGAVRAGAKQPLHDDGFERNTIFLENARVLCHERLPGDQYWLRVDASRIAATALPGNFVHIRCDEMLALRRPMSILRADRQSGSVEFLYKPVGQGTRLLARRLPGDALNLLGPIGKPFSVSEDSRLPLLLGGGVGVPPMIFLAEYLRRRPKAVLPLVLIGSERPFPFKPCTSQILVPGMPSGVFASLPLLEDLRIPGRLASLQGLSGCFAGYVTDLARTWLTTRDTTRHAKVAIFACGPVAMIKAAVALAQEFKLPCQVSLEEFMACGVGGCAGCTVAIETAAGPTMKRVCVDGPVFDGHRVIWQ